MKTDTNADPLLSIRTQILNSVCDDPDADPTPDQLQLVERYRVELRQVLSQYQPVYGRRILEFDDRDRDRNRDRGLRLIREIQRTMLGVRPHKLRALIHSATNELWKDFERNWREWKWTRQEAEEQAYVRSVLSPSELRPPRRG